MSDLKDAANEAYYGSDEKIITDHEFDLLDETGLGIKDFRNKVDHFQPMGSLKKIKTEENYLNFLSGQKKIFVSPKLDGNSIELVLVDGVPVQGITRGNGFVGNDVTDKIAHCELRIHEVPAGKTSIKCEALMPKVNQADYEKNIRNIVAGALNRKTAQPEELAKVHVVSFEGIQVEMENPTYEKLEALFHDWKENHEYEIDGLVVKLADEIHVEKNQLLPENCVALKFNKDGIAGEIGEIEWNLGKHGRLTPVMLLKEPIEIDGTMVKRVSASNFGLLNETGMNVGAEVKVIKSGDIIPFVSEVVEMSINELQVPNCPKCGSLATISDNGVHAICENCSDDKLTHLQHIFSLFDLDFVSSSTIETLFDEGSYTELLDYFQLHESDLVQIGGIGKSKAQNIISKIRGIKLTEAKVLECAMIQGVGSKQCQKLLDHYGDIETFVNISVDRANEIESIDGFAKKSAEKIRKNFYKFNDVYRVLSRNIEIIREEKTEGGIKVVCTGKCDQYGRKELAKILGDMGYEMQGSVNNETGLLLTDDVDSNSGKTKKAKKLGIEIKSYNEILNG